MLGKHSLFLRWVVVVLAGCALRASAGVFNMPAGQTSLQFVPVGDPGNEPDSTGYGAVPYAYQMGEFDVTVAQYTQFLNSIAASDPYGLYSPSMNAGAATGSCGILRTGNSGDYTYSYPATNANFPVNAVSWLSAARFCNWLDNGQPDSGVENSGTTEDGSYALNGATGALSDPQLSEITRSPNAIYVIPTENEWYKAAYYKGGSTDAGYWLYPTQSDSTPSNVLSITGTDNANYYNGGYTDPTNILTPVGAFADSPGPYGTYDMGGDVIQWNESVLGDDRGIIGGGFASPASALASSANQFSNGASQTSTTVGFRIAEVPEPDSAVVLGLATVLCLWRRKSPQRRRSLK